MKHSLRLIGSVTRAFTLWGVVGGFGLGAGLPLLLLPLVLVAPLFGGEAEFGALFLVSVVGALTGGIVGFATGLVVGLLSATLTVLFFRSRMDTPGHRRAVRAVAVLTAGSFMFFGVFFVTGSLDMSAESILYWRLPTALVAALFGWWLSRRLLDNYDVWHPDEGGDQLWPAMQPWDYGRR